MSALTGEQIKEITSLPAKITRSIMVDLFSHSSSGKDSRGRTKVLPPKYHVTDTFIVTPEMLDSVKTPVKTTIGIYLFNLVCLHESFGNVLEYYNDTLSDKNFGKLHGKLLQMIIDKKITSKQMIRFYNNIVFMTTFSELFTPSVSTKFLGAPKEVKELKSKLIEENKDIIDAGDATGYSLKVEKPLLEETERIMSKDPCWSLIGYKKGKFLNNVIKNNCITNGAIFDSTQDKFVISTNSYMDGIPTDKYTVYGNMAISGSYMRNIETQYGGAQTKYLFSAMQYAILDEPDSDCGTTKTIKVLLTNSNKEFYIYRYFVENGQVLHMTKDIVDKYVGKEVEFRTPLFCKSKNICNHCFNSLYYSMGIKYAGLTSTRATATIMGIAMSAMHDSTIKPVKVNVMEYITVVR